MGSLHAADTLWGLALAVGCEWDIKLVGMKSSPC